MEISFRFTNQSYIVRELRFCEIASDLLAFLVSSAMMIQHWKRATMMIQHGLSRTVLVQLD